MNLSNILDYHNRHDPAKRYKRHLIRDGYGLQAAEHNEMQDVAHDRLRSIGDALWSDGDIIAGLEVSVNQEEGKISCAGGTVYIDGEIHVIEPATLSIPSDADVVAGIWYTEELITELQDGDLRDPAVGTPNFQQPGAWRVKIATFWGLAGESHESTNKEAKFYGLHNISGGEVVSQKQSEINSQISQASEIIRRYDYDSNGSYITTGLTVKPMDMGDDPDFKGKHVYVISEGKAHIMGKEVNFPYSTRLVVDEHPTLNEVESEEHRFVPGDGGKMRVLLAHEPVDVISTVRVTRERTVQVNHGSRSGVTDKLPHESVTRIVKVWQDTKVYSDGSDYRLLNDGVSWDPPGDEPAPGSAYQVTYQYRLIVQPQDQDTQGFTIGDSVEGELVTVRYSYRLPRYDLILLDSDGNVSVSYGTPHRWAPAVPRVPSGVLKLATVHQLWDGLPNVDNDGIRTTTMKDLVSIRAQIEDLYDLTAQERLKTDAIASAPTSSRGVFVDPFFDDDMRDAGIEQKAAIVGGTLMLPIDAEINDAVEDASKMISFSHEVILSQNARSGSMKINPYQAQEPLPAILEAVPSVDHWTEVGNVVYTSPTTATITTSRTKAEAEAAGVRWGGSTYINRGTSTSTQTVSSSVIGSATEMRQRSVAVKGKGFGTNEEIAELKFGGVKVSIGSQKADANGNINVTFTVPKGIPTGTVRIEVVGAGGSYGSCTYTASGTITQETRRVVTTLYRDYYDPLAQTFVLDETRLVTGVDIFFTKRGASEVRVQIRDVLAGMPNRTVYAQGRIAREDIKQNQSNRILFDKPVILEADTEYALVVLTDTADHELAIAELGKWDSTNAKWLTSQAYQTGVLLSSSNASSWTAHQTMDLWFQLLGAKFSTERTTIELGTVTLNDATDLLPLAEVDFPSASSEATFVLCEKANDKEVVRVQAGQALELTEALSGEYKLKVEMAGGTKLSPVLYAGLQFVAGSLGDNADYISRLFPCGDGKKLLVTLNVYTPGESAIHVSAQTKAGQGAASGDWTAASQKSAVEIGDGWETRTYEVPCNLSETRIKITLSGTPKDRPYAQSLRAVVLDA